MTVPFSGLAEAGAKQTTKVGNYNIDHAVLNGIKHASKSTGVDFGYLMAQAAQESSFQAEARAGTSSATGLYQFIDSTWLSMMRTHGAKYGFADLASRIQPDGRGGFSVPDAGQKQQILDLRKDPKVSAVIGAEFALSNKEHLEGELGRKVGSTELYLAHFLGAGGASRFLKAIDRNAAQPAADLLPQAAASNRAVFYDRETGRPRTVGDIYKLFAKSIETKQAQFNGAGEGVQLAVETTNTQRSTNSGRSTGPTGSTMGGFLAAPPSAGGTLGASVADINGPTLSLLSILALAALDPSDPTTSLGKDDGEGRVIHGNGRITRGDGSPAHRDPLRLDPTAKRTIDQSI